MKKFFKKLFPSKEMRSYLKTHRRHRKELMKLAKQDADFDYGWLDDFVHLKIKHMYEYFSERNNVWQSEDSLNEILDQLKHVLDLYDELDHLYDAFSNGCDCIKNEDGSMSTTEDSTKNYLCKMDREQELYKEIYSYIGKHIQYWWD